MTRVLGRLQITHQTWNPPTVPRISLRISDEHGVELLEVFVQPDSFLFTLVGKGWVPVEMARRAWMGEIDPK